MPFYNWVQRDSGYLAYSSKGIALANLVLWVDASKTGSYPGTGTVWYDISGNSNNMTLFNCTYTGTNAIVFNGTSSYTQSPNLITPFTTSNFQQTQEIWFLNQYLGTGVASGVLIDELGQTTINTGWHDTQLELVNGNLYARLWNSASVQMSGTYSTGASWVYAALRYNPGTLVFDLFLNGVKSNSATSYSRINATPGYYATLGAADSQNLGSGAWYKGQIAIYRTYNRALTDAEILQNYTTDASGFSKSTIKVNIIAASETAAWYSDVLSKINSAMTANWPGKTLVITQNNSSTYAGADLTKANYDAVFIWADGAYSGSTLGTNLNTYISGGGNLIICVFASASVQISGFNYTNTPCVYPGNQSMASTSLGVFTASDPIMKNVVSFNPGTSRYGAGSLALQSGATTVAAYNDGNILVAKKIIGSSSRTVTLNFFPPSNAARSDFWNATTDGGKIMANSIVWAGYGTS